jgi:hypothetical protein
VNDDDERRIHAQLAKDWRSLETARDELDGYLRQVCARLSLSQDVVD